MSTKKIIITGVNGFVGQHLVADLVASGHAVIGIGRDTEAAPSLSETLTDYRMADLAKAWPDDMGDVDAVIHLAGLAAVGPSFSDPQTYISQNSAMVTNLCEFYLSKEHKPRIVLVSSGAVYDPKQPMPITESSPVAFNSPYAVSKVLNENQAAYYGSRGLECVVMRPFNHIGPNQGLGFIVPDLAKKLADRTSPDEPITAGDLSSRRDYTDVRDVARAYRLVATAEKAPDHLIYNVCSGESRSGSDVLDSIAAACAVPIPEVSVDQALVRPNDTPDIRGDSSRIATEYGWKPSFTFEQSINDFIEALK